MPNITGIAALGASLDLLLDAGADAIWAHVDVLCDQVCEGLDRLGADVLSDRSLAKRSGIVSATVPGHDADQLRTALRAEGVVVGARSGAIRVAPHGYNTAEEIDRMLAAVERLVQARR